jgi:hypothetical protein
MPDLKERFGVGAVAREREMVAKWRSLGASWGAVARNLGRNEQDVRRLYDVTVDAPRPATTVFKAPWTPITGQHHVLATLTRAPQSILKISEVTKLTPFTVNNHLYDLRSRALVASTNKGWTITDTGVAHLERLRRGA